MIFFTVEESRSLRPSRDRLGDTATAAAVVVVTLAPEDDQVCCGTLAIVVVAVSVAITATTVNAAID